MRRRCPASYVVVTTKLDQTGNKTIANIVVTDNRFSAGNNTNLNATWQSWDHNYRYSASGVDRMGDAIAAP